MTAIQIPIGKCFSSDSMSGAYYHEYNKDNRTPHTCHRYDKDGLYVMHSTIDIAELMDDDYYVSDRFGNRINESY